MPHRRFPPKLRVLASVPRWSIIPTIKTNDVASHSFFVSVYAYQIARMINWQGPMDVLLWRSISHDIEECITGDIVGLVKRAITDEDKMDKYIAGKMKEKLPFIEDGSITTQLVEEQINSILKLADRMDALFFVMTEIQLGNCILGTRLDKCKEDVKELTFKLPVPLFTCRLLWDKIIMPAIIEHDNPEAYGV